MHRYGYSYSICIGMGIVIVIGVGIGIGMVDRVALLLGMDHDGTLQPAVCLHRLAWACGGGVIIRAAS